MSEEQQPQAGNAAPKGPQVNFPQLLDLCGGVLGRLFFKLPKEKSKELFTEIKKGGSPELGDITLGEAGKLKMTVSLNRKEFVGPGLNHEVFLVALKNLLERIGTTIKHKQDLNLRTNKTGGVLVGFAGLTRVGEQHNTLMMSLDLGTSGVVSIHLMFVDPTQFDES